MTETIWVAIITSIIAPTVLFILQSIRSKRDKKTEQLMHTLQDIDLRVRRMVILENIREHPDDEHTILDLFDKYQSKGGNSYIKMRVQQWQKDFQLQPAPRHSKK